MRELEKELVWRIDPGSREERVYKNLENQIERVFRHCRQGSIRTRRRYEDGTKHVAKFLATVYNKQNLNNISNKALEAYVEQAQEAGYSTSYITTNMSALRFFIDQIKDSRYVKSNAELGVNSRTQIERIGPNRAWTGEQVRSMFKLANENGYNRVADIIRISYAQGFRLHEVTRLDRATLLEAIRKDEITIKGKGGLIRKVPIRNDKAREHIQYLAKQTPTNSYKVFVKSNEKTHKVMKEVQNFIHNYRDKVIIEGEHPITVHGLRHTYAQEKFQELLNEGMLEYEAKLIVSRELGHFRPDITDTYL